MSITKRDVDEIQPGQVIWDTGRGAVTGFGVRCQRRTRVFVVKYVWAGKARWYTIGRFGSPWTVEQARDEARRVFGEIVQGRQPQAAKKAAELESRRSLSVAELCDRYLAAADTGLILTRFRRPKKASTLSIDRGRIRRHIKPLMGEERLVSVTATTVRRMIQDITAGKTATDVKTGWRGRAIVTGGSGTAARVADLLSGIMAWAVEEELIESNPVHGVKRHRGEGRDRFLSNVEITALGEVLRSGTASDGRPFNASALAIARLLLLTGCRAGEVENLRWEEVDLEQRCMRLDDTKTGKSLRPISAIAANLLSTLPRQADSRFVFPATRQSRANQGTELGMRGAYQGAKREINRILASAKIRAAGRHTLRHTFASIASELGYSDATIAGLLGHKGRGLTSRYVHRPDSALLAAADRIATTISHRLGLSAEVPEPQSQKRHAVNPT